MFNPKQNVCCSHNRNRTLRSELLENRELLSVTPMVSMDAFVPPEVKHVACEEGKMMMDVDMTVDYKTPAGEIYIPETIDGPSFGKTPGEIQYMPGSELGQTTPLPEGLDPGSLPVSSCQPLPARSRVLRQSRLNQSSGLVISNLPGILLMSEMSCVPTI